jgi:hypothetical protein
MIIRANANVNQTSTSGVKNRNLMPSFCYTNEFYVISLELIREFTKFDWPVFADSTGSIGTK